MLVVRLARAGTKKRPFYHLVVADSRCARDGRYIERIGLFNPIAAGNDISLRVDLPRLTYWTDQGAQCSDRVVRLVSDYRLAQDTAQAA